MNYEIRQQNDITPTVRTVWFSEYTTLRRVSGATAFESDCWVATDADEIEDLEDIKGMVLMERGIKKGSPFVATVLRLGVRPEYRRQGIGSALLDRINEEYGKLALDCRESLDANKFYEATGWVRKGERIASPEKLIHYERE